MRAPVPRATHPTPPRSQVMAGTGWQELTVVGGSSLTPVPAGMDAAMMLGALGTNGYSALGSHLASLFCSALPRLKPLEPRWL